MRRRPSGPSITLTGRGGIVVIFSITLLGALLGGESVLDVGMLAGLSFVIGCVLAAVATRRADLLTIAASPPLSFFLVMLAASIIGALGGGALLQGVFVGLVTGLTAGAPWLFLGTLLVVAITLPRGLLACLRELRTRPAMTDRRAETDDDDPVRWDEPHSRP
ncbi:MAG: DUF6542 domain-containing protein [Actinomadura sp.]